MIAAGRRVKVMPQMKVEQGTTAARTIFGRGALTDWFHGLNAPFWLRSRVGAQSAGEFWQAFEQNNRTSPTRVVDSRKSADDLTGFHILYNAGVSSGHAVKQGRNREICGPIS
jgi:hypothetical protein